MAGDKERHYDASDLKELMDNTGGWAKNWDEVLRYLHGPAPYDSDFAKDEVPDMIRDVESLKKKDFPFTTDYRKMWAEITGKSTKDMPKPNKPKVPPAGMIRLEDEYLKGLRFPASKKAVLDKAKENHSPQEVMDMLEGIDDETYENMGRLMESVGDVAWDH